jgi:predicted amidophosphoribosyltransferase
MAREMDWITSLLDTLCPFCGAVLGNCSKACSSCAHQIALFETTSPKENSFDDLKVLSLGFYEDWFQKFVLTQKGRPHPTSLNWIAEVFIRKIPTDWQNTPIVWVPGKTFGAIHLVEALALTLRQFGADLIENPILQRPVLRRSVRRLKPQKKLSRDLRKTKSYDSAFETVPRKSQVSSSRLSVTRVLLLDDVVTTGSTLLGCRRLLEENLGYIVQGALTLAYTPRRDSHKNGV